MLEACSQNIDFLYRNHEKELGSHIWCTCSTHDRVFNMELDSCVFGWIEGRAGLREVPTSPN